MKDIQFVKGEWYKVTTKRTRETYYLRFDYIDGGKWWASEYITFNPANYNKVTGFLYVDDLDKIEKVPVGKLKKYLPKDHKDLIKLKNINNI